MMIILKTYSTKFLSCFIVVTFAAYICTMQTAWTQVRLDVI